uniref:solute carrier family 22 member 14 n=1 Tax=Jaculus jaculus TaxID=51337 RepID=UPI00064CE5AA|nr:solute carrier family 22 member 14 [Jaculus jaculus]
MSHQNKTEDINKLEEEDNFRGDLRTHALRKVSQQEGSCPTGSQSLEKLRRLRALDSKQDDKLANVLDAVGEFGTFQRRLVALTFIPNMLSAFFLYADYFVFTHQTPYCNTSWILAVGPNLSEAEQLNLTLPRARNGSFQTCLMYLPVSWDLNSIITFGLNYTEICQDGWIYPDSKTRSLVNEFDLVCGNEPSKEMVHTINLAGILSGSLIFGSISDRFGRYPAVLLSLLGMAIFGFGTAFVGSFRQYLFFRFMVSQAVVGYVISSVSLVMEWLVGEHRAHAIILEHCFFAVGHLAVSGFAYGIPHWRLLFLVGGMPMLPFVSYIWIVQESPRWLMMKGKVEEAKKALCYAADMNKTLIPPSLLKELHPLGKKLTKASILDFYNNKHLFKVVMAMGCVWFTVSYTYFSMNRKMKQFGMNVYFGQVILGIMDVPARLCYIFFLEQIGRKWSLTLTLTQATIISFILLFLPQELKSTMVVVLVLGQFTLASTVTVFFIYTAELLPTVLRSTGLGMVSLSWAAGAILSLTIFSQISSQLPIFLCCICSILALCFTSLVPETQDQPLYDSLHHLSRSSFQKDSLEENFNTYWRESRDLSPMKTGEEESLSDDASDEGLENTAPDDPPLILDPYDLSDAAPEKPYDMEEPSLDS